MTPPDITPEIAAILQILNAPLQQALAGQEALRKEVDGLSRELALQKERNNAMSEDLTQFEQRLDAMEDKIIASQQKAANRIIAFQSAILLLIIGAAITYYFAVLH